MVTMKGQRMNRMYRTLSGALILAVAMTCGGCTPDIQVTLDAVEADGTVPSVEVHLIAVQNASEYRRLRDQPMSEVWSNLRTDEKTFVMTLGEGRENPQVLSSSDPIWGEWGGAKMLFVLASYPPSIDLPGDADPRRLIVPLKSGYWKSTPIPIRIRTTGIVCDAAYKPWNPFED
jgi:hypothetical protein